MIERHWKGTCRAEKAHDYLDHLKEETFKQLELIDGYLGARVLKRDVGEGVEFLVITIWDSMSAIQQFSGDDPTLAVVPPKVLQMMVAYEERAIHYEIEQKLC